GLAFAMHCDKPCPLVENPGCVIRDAKCYFTMKNACHLMAVNCYRKSKGLSPLKAIQRRKCEATQVPVCKNIDT
ncbi:hypothetical protein KR018_004401, partial [Drosophila ironensis]